MAGWQDSLNRCYVSYLQNVPGLLGTLDRKAPFFDFLNDFNSKILLQKMVARYRQSCMAILMDYASQCDGVFCGHSKRKINIKYFLIPAYNKYLSQSLQVCSLRLSHTGWRDSFPFSQKSQFIFREPVCFNLKGFFVQAKSSLNRFRLLH